LKNFTTPYLPEKGYKRIIVVSIYLLIAYVLYAFLSKWLMLCITPFILGWLAAYIVQKPVTTLYEKKHIPKKITSAFYIILLTSLPASVLFLLVSKIISEGYRAYLYLKADIPGITEEFIRLSGRILDFVRSLPFVNESSAMLSEEVNKYISETLVSTSGKLISFIPGAAAGIAELFPKVLIFVIIFCISAFYLSVDFSSANTVMLSVLSPELQIFCRKYKREFFSVSKNYLRAYLFIFLISLGELFLGLTLLRVDHAFSAAFMIAFVDILPVLGCGTVLIPWSIIEFVSGNIALGSGIIVLYLIITLVRQLTEPKIVGNFIGLHPLASLMCIFAGLSLFGVAGIFLMPIAVISFINVLKREKHT